MFTPQLVPRLKPSFWIKSYRIGNDSWSLIENEKNNNPRLQVSSKEQYAEIMNNLNLSNPKMMDVAVPANLKGLTLDQIWN